MKKSWMKKGIALLASVVVGLGSIAYMLPTITASAGMSEQKVVTQEMYDETLSEQKWYKTRDIAHEKGKIIFDKAKTDEESKIVSIILANDLRDMGIETCLKGTLTIKVKDTLDGEFYLGFGLARPYSAVDSASAICLYNDNGAVGVKVQNFAGEQAGVVYTAPTTYAYGEEMIISFDIFSAGTMMLEINGQKLLNYDNQTKVASTGYFGFGQSAASSVEIYNAEVRAATYDRPTNSNINETFSDGFNAALLYSEGGASGYYTPEKVVCEDGVLKFSNVTVTGYISTRYEYSNFSMTYDIPHIQRVAEKDAEGNIITPATNWMGISIGCSTVKTNSAVAIAQSLFFYMMPIYENGSMSCVLLNNYTVLKIDSISGDKNFFAVENGVDGNGQERTVNLKVEMIDGILQVFSKYENEPASRYAKIFEYNLGYTPMGYLQIWGYGDDFSYVQNNMANGNDSYCANFWIDNLKIENKDVEPNLVEVGFQSSKFPEVSDYVYVDRWDNRAETIFKADAPVQEEGCGSSVAFGSVALLLLAGGAMAIKKGGKKE